MTPYDKELINAIMARLAPDMATALRDYSIPMMVTPGLETVTLPLRADVRVAYDYKVADFVVKAKAEGFNKGEKTWLQQQTIFSTREIKSSRDTAAMVEYLFDEMKHQFLSKLADSGLQEILKIAQPRKG